jgi:hypothetical protein
VKNLVRQAVEGNMQENTLLTIFPNGKGHESMEQLILAAEAQMQVASWK